jgi:hypothetical protein
MAVGTGEGKGGKRCILRFTLGRGVYRSLGKKIFTGKREESIKE